MGHQKAILAALGASDSTNPDHGARQIMNQLSHRSLFGFLYGLNINFYHLWTFLCCIAVTIYVLLYACKKTRLNKYAQYSRVYIVTWWNNRQLQSHAYKLAKQNEEIGANMPTAPPAYKDTVTSDNNKRDIMTTVNNNTNSVQTQVVRKEGTQYAYSLEDLERLQAHLDGIYVVTSEDKESQTIEELTKILFESSTKIIGLSLEELKEIWRSAHVDEIVRKIKLKYSNLRKRSTPHDPSERQELIKAKSWRKAPTPLIREN